MSAVLCIFTYWRTDCLFRKVLRRLDRQTDTSEPIRRTDRGLNIHRTDGHVPCLPSVRPCTTLDPPNKQTFQPLFTCLGNNTIKRRWSMTLSLHWELPTQQLKRPTRSSKVRYLGVLHIYESFRRMPPAIIGPGQSSGENQCLI